MKNAKDLVGDLDGLKSFDIIVFSSGIIAHQEKQVTEEGIELDLAVSFLSRLAFIKKLFESGKFASKRGDSSVKPRVFIIGYPGKDLACDLDDFNSQKNYSPMTAHSRTVAGNEALVEYTSRLNRNINVFGVNPGLIQTGIRENLIGKTDTSYLAWGIESTLGLLTQSAQQYAENYLVHFLLSPAYENGKCNTLFANDGSELAPSPSLTVKVRVRLMQESEDLLEKASKALVNKGALGKLMDKGMKAVGKVSEKIEKEFAEVSNDAKTSMGVAAVAKGGLGL
jgi:hypothetical protein